MDKIEVLYKVPIDRVINEEIELEIMQKREYLQMQKIFTR